MKHNWGNFSIWAWESSAWIFSTLGVTLFYPWGNFHPWGNLEACKNHESVKIREATVKGPVKQNVKFCDGGVTGESYPSIQI